MSVVNKNRPPIPTGTCPGETGGRAIIGVVGESFAPADATFYRRGQDAVAIGRHLTTLHGDRKLLERLSGQAVDFAAQYHPDRVLPRLEAALAQAISVGRR